MEEKSNWLMALHFAAAQVGTSAKLPQNGHNSSDFVINAANLASKASSAAVERIYCKMEARSSPAPLDV